MDADDGGDLVVELAELEARESAARWVSGWLAAELRIPEERVSWAVCALVEVALTPALPAKVRTHRRQQVRGALFDRQPVRGGRYPAEVVREPLRRLELDDGPVARPVGSRHRGRRSRAS